MDTIVWFDGLNNDMVVYLALVIIGALTAFINVMAGGGSIITLGAMILLGIDAQVANATNRVAILVESVSAITVFKKHLKTSLRESYYYAVWTLPGAIAGAFYSVEISSENFQRVLSVIICFVVLTILLPLNFNEEKKPKEGPLLYFCLVMIGFYGGFIQVGIGFVIMVCFKQLTSLSLVQINLHKVFMVLIYSFPVICVFAFSGNINWIYAFYLSIGTALGAWASVRLSVSRGDKVIKLITAASMIGLALYLWLST